MTEREREEARAYIRVEKKKHGRQWYSSKDICHVQLCLAMDFYHVLPSNTSPNYFPKNNAAEYSTPLDNPYVLSGDWEVGLMDLTYSTCVNTFNNDVMTVTETNDVAAYVKRSNRPFKVMLPVPTNPFDVVGARDELVAHIGRYFKTLLQVTITSDKKWADWKLLTDDFYFVVSPGIENMFQLSTDALTKLDESFRNATAFFKKFVPTEQSDVFIIIVPAGVSKFMIRRTYTMKTKGEKITPEQLLERFQQKVPVSIASLTMNAAKQFRLNKLYNDSHFVLLNAPLEKALTFRRAGMFRKGHQQHFSYSFYNFETEWLVFIISIMEIPVFPRIKGTRTITLPPFSFDDESKAMAFVNSKVNDERIAFSCDASTKHTALAIKNENLSLTLDDNLRDIFGFDNNTFFGKKTYTATRTFSLWRCIQFLYIYSNISDYVRIGNTQAPLLAIAPFSNTDGCSLLKEKIFKTPMYLPVRQNHISQIDIGIYDGAGQLVPFVENSKTTLRLHFRPI